MSMMLPKTFWEVHSDLPREGPGDNKSTRKAYQLLKNLPSKPRILDVGCGPGVQTIELARVSGSHITAVDNYQPFLDQLTGSAKKANLSDKICAVKGNMFNLGYEKQSFDLIWCEGAIFIIGFEKGLREWRPLLADNGYLVVSEMCWLKLNPPQEIKSYLNEVYPQCITLEDNIELASKSGYRVIDTFVLPQESWFAEYYTPIEAKLPSLKAKHRCDPEALQYLASEEKEIAMFRKFHDYYGYAFCVLQKLGP
jgi:ubiquinone/menaquinone biosynthesis C-methylase UbiE